MGHRIKVCIAVALIIMMALLAVCALLSSDFFSMRGFGDDTVFADRNCNFEIVKAVDKDLVFLTSPYHAEIVLKKVEKYKKYRGNLFVVSNNGYAIIYVKDNICKVLYYTSDMPGDVGVISNNIEVLNSFEDFSEIEKNVFTNILK